MNDHDEAQPYEDDYEVTETPRRRPAGRARKRILVATAVMLGALLIAAAGVAYAGYQFSEQHEGKILPGARIAGVDVGGLTEEQAVEAVREKVGPQLDRSIEVYWRGESWTVTPRELGAKSDARAAVRHALEDSSQASFADKVKMRLLDERLGFEREVAITYLEQGAMGFVKGIAASIDEDAKDAELDYSTGWVEITEEETGRKVQAKKTHEALMAALQEGTTRVQLAVKETEPEKTTEDFKQVLLVRIGENKLHLYQDGDITHTWNVGPGLPEYPTPTGLFEVTLKRFMPTWVNPSPDTWGKDLPESIPPGPGNPLGMRAINWDAPAIRFHGTSATYSLGYNASHGCVRMSNADVIQLYDLIDVGVPIVSIQVAPFKPLRRAAPDPIPVSGEGAEEDAAADAQRTSDKKKQQNTQDSE
jgi:lipoprotein-anchoring transpeptidase ErfK/SrfK